MKYHAVRKIPVPISHRDVKGMQYTELIDLFGSAGFVSVKTEVIYDLLTGWLTDDGSVKSVTIDGQSKFDVEDLQTQHLCQQTLSVKKAD